MPWFKFQIAGRLSRHNWRPNELLNWKMLQTCTTLGLRLSLCVPPEPLLKWVRFTWDTSKEMRVSQISFVCVCVQLLNWSRFTWETLKQVGVSQIRWGLRLPGDKSDCTAGCVATVKCCMFCSYFYYVVAWWWFFYEVNTSCLLLSSGLPFIPRTGAF